MRISGQSVRAHSWKEFTNVSYASIWKQVEKESADQNIVSYVLNLTDRLKRCQESAVKCVTECQENRKVIWYDRNAISRKFKMEGQTLILATSTSHKMIVDWIEQIMVTVVVSDTNHTTDLLEKYNSATIYITLIL